jgi:hypothetical protein
MIVKGSNSEKREFQIAPVGSHLARLYRIIDLGTQKSEYMGQVKMLRKVKFFWELHGDELKIDGKPLIQTRNYTLSLGEKASLRKDLESWRGKSFTDDELRGFDLKNLLDKWCMVTIQHRTAGNGNTYADAVAVTPVPSIVLKAGLPQGVNPCVLFDLQKFDQKTFDELSQGLKDQIMQSAEFRNTHTPKSDVNALLQDAALEDDVPF